MSANPKERLPMAHGMGGALMTAAMIIMMLGMAGFSLAFLRRAVPAAWRERIARAARRPAGLPHMDGKEGAR
jgi:uncharacterized membrane protein